MIRIRFIVSLFLLLGLTSASAETNRSVYQVFHDSAAIAERGKIPVVFLDIDDTLIRTAFRYLDVLEALNHRFEIFPRWSQVRSESWRASHHVTPQDLVYADSFEKTLRLSLEKLVTSPELMEKMYRPNEKGVPLAMQTFFEVFFDPSKVEKDAMFSGSVYFLNNLLSEMRTLGGKVVFLSGRADKYLDVTKRSLVYNGISSELLTGPHVLWYLKPSSGKINYNEDVQLDFKNDKSGMITSILEADPRLEVAGFVDNEARNVFSLVGHSRLSGEKLYFFRSVDATWGAPSDGEVVTGFLDRIRQTRDHFTQFDSYVARPDQAKNLKGLFERKGILYLNDEALKKLYGINRERIRRLMPVEACVRQLTVWNAKDLEMIRDLIVP